MSDEDSVDNTQAAQESGSPRVSRFRRGIGTRWLPWTLAGLFFLAAIGGVTSQPEDQSAKVDTLTADLQSARGQVAASQKQISDFNSRVTDLNAQIADLEAELDRVRASKIKTLIQTKTVTKSVPRWVPNGKGIKVELTGFEGEIEIHDVHIKHQYGYTSVVGIAINTSGSDISYAELGCSLLSESGKVLANAFTNKTDWRDGSSWGFDCSDQVNATGAILRVDELS